MTTLVAAAALAGPSSRAGRGGNDDQHPTTLHHHPQQPGVLLVGDLVSVTVMQLLGDRRGSTALVPLSADCHAGCAQAIVAKVCVGGGGRMGGYLASNRPAE